MATTYRNKFVYIVIPTVPHVDVSSITKTAISSVTETDLFTDSSIRHTRMSICQPACCVSTTPVIRRTWSRQSGSCGSFKTIPASSNAPVTIPMVGCVGYLPVCSIKALVVLTFWEKIYQWVKEIERFQGELETNLWLVLHRHISGQEK